LRERRLARTAATTDKASEFDAEREGFSMRTLTSMTRLTLVAGTALMVAACGGGADSAANNAVANDLESNLMLDAPGNDASAMDAMTNVAEPLPTANVGDTANETDEAPPPVASEESNVAGM
jgi:hypothetical protein